MMITRLVASRPLCAILLLNAFPFTWALLIKFSLHPQHEYSLNLWPLGSSLGQKHSGERLSYNTAHGGAVAFASLKGFTQVA
jgi:hypothetical protein